MHDYASLFTNFRGGAGRQTFYLFDKLKKVLIIFIMAFLYDYPLVQTTILTVIGLMSAATTFVASPCQYLIPLTLFFTIPPPRLSDLLTVPASLHLLAVALTCAIPVRSQMMATRATRTNRSWPWARLCPSCLRLP